MMGALLEEVYGQDFATSPSAPKKCDTVDELPQIRQNIEEKEATQQTQETFVSPQKKELPIIQDKDGFPLYIAILVTGVCSLYALDLFATTISRK